MSKEMTKAELEKHIDTCIDELKQYLYELNDEEHPHSKKRSMLISYWLRDFVRYASSEDSFVPPDHKYYRGDIVLANFGYRVGSELGGWHFAVVLDHFNSKRSPIISVVPLSSKKEGEVRKPFAYEASVGLATLYHNKRIEFLKVLSESIVEVERIRDEIKNNSSANIEQENIKLHQLEELVKIALRQMYAIDNMDNQIKKLKDGTVVSVSQITTISKQRIVNPKQNADALSGIKLSNEDLDKLNEHINYLFVHGNR